MCCCVFVDCAVCCLAGLRAAHVRGVHAVAAALLALAAWAPRGGVSEIADEIGTPDPRLFHVCFAVSRIIMLCSSVRHF